MAQSHIATKDAPPPPTFKPLAGRVRGNINHTIKRHREALQNILGRKMAKHRLYFQQTTTTRVGHRRISIIGECVGKILVFPECLRQIRVGATRVCLRQITFNTNQSTKTISTHIVRKRMAHTLAPLRHGG